MKLRKNMWSICGSDERMWQTVKGPKVLGLILIGQIVLGLMAMALLGHALEQMSQAQAMTTTTVQGTVYLANGKAGAGTLSVSWPAFTTANSEAVTAGRTNVTIAPDGFVSVNLAPNLGATPAGLYYTAVYHMSDGTASTEYWVVPAAAQAALGQVRAQLMPAAQAVQAVSKAYVDQAISELTQSLLTASGGTLSGPLYLNGDPTQALQAADKHYVDSTFSMEVPIAGGSMTGPLATPALNGVQSPVAGSSQTTLQAAINAAGTNGAMMIPPTYAGTDGFTNPNGVRVMDLRANGAQQTERSVKEFGAVCDGVTDDTSALQAALNYAQTHGVALTIPQGTCKTRSLNWHGESIGGMGKQVSALMGFPGQDVLATVTDSPNLLPNTRLHDLTIYVDQSTDVSCSAGVGRAPAGGCAVGRQMEKNSIFSPGGNGLTGTAGAGAAWAVGNCAIAMPAATGTGGNGLRVAEIENLAIVATGTDPMAAQYPGAHSTHTCGLYLAQWPQWSEFRNVDIRGVNTGIAIPALPVTAPAGLNSDSNRWENITIEATHGFTAAAGSNNVLDNVVVLAGNSAAAGEAPTGVVLDFPAAQQGWTVRNAEVAPSWNAVQPQLTVTAAGGAVTGVTTGAEHGLGFDSYGAQVPLKFSGSCTAQAVANVNAGAATGSIGTVTVTQGGVGCAGTTTASVNVAGNWNTAAPVNLISGQNMTFFGGNLLRGTGGYSVWNATGSHNYGTQFGGGGKLAGGEKYAALVANSALGTAQQVDQFPGADFGAMLQACLETVSSSYGGTCDARNFTGTLQMGSNVTISTGNATVLLPCATISTASQIIVTAGTRNVSLRGCSLRGASTASGSQGGTVFLYSGTGAMVQVGDPTYAAETMGFHLDNVVINTTAASSATVNGLIAYRTQEMDLESLYFLGNSNQTGMTLDGTGNYTGGTFFDNAFNGFQTAVNAIGHQTANSATTDWVNASTFVRLHINCPMNGNSPISGTYGINLAAGDGNTFTGGDVEGCDTALHLGANAQNNTIIGLRNEQSNNQVVADTGSSYNSWIAGGTMFTGQLTDNGTRNSFLDTFHRSFNGVNGDWYGSQKDATITNHYRIGIGTGNERGLLDRYQTDYGYRWTTGLSDATEGEQYYQIQDELNNVYRLSIGQYNNGQASTNNQTVVNAAGTGAVVLNGSNNAGTGGVVIGSGGANSATVATINNAGSAQFNGTLLVSGTSTFTGTPTVKNQANAEIDATLWAGLTSSQKESFVYKDWNGSSQWYMVKDASNNWALNSATGGIDSFKAYQSNNSGDTYVNASNASGVVRINYETGSGTAFNIYGGASSPLYASFTAANAIKFPGLAASSGRNCLQIDNSGYITNTGSACGAGSGGTNGTVGSGDDGQIAYYMGSGTSIGGMSAVPLTAGGTGAGSAASALANLGGLPSAGGTMTGMLNGTSGSFLGTVAVGAAVAFATQTAAAATVTNLGQTVSLANVSGVDITGATDSGPAITTFLATYKAAAPPYGKPITLLVPPGNYKIGATVVQTGSYVTIQGAGGVFQCYVTPCWNLTGWTSGINNNFRDTKWQIMNLLEGPLVLDGAFNTLFDNFGMVGGTTLFGANYLIQSNGDQHVTVDNTNINGWFLNCSSSFCGSMLYGPAGDASIWYVDKSTLQPECQGNGATFNSGNDVHIQDTVIQGFSEYAVEYGGGTDIQLDKVHMEAGGCANPLGNVGKAALIVNGGKARVQSSQLGGGQPTFPVTGTAGTYTYAYYVVVRDNTGNYTLPLGAGVAGNGPATTLPSAMPFAGGQTITVTFPSIPGAVSCDVLVQQVFPNPFGGPGPNNTAPYGGTVYSIGSAGLGITCNAGTVTSADTGIRTLYSMPSSASIIPLPYWPGAVVLAGIAQGMIGGLGATSFVGDSDYGLSGFVNENLGPGYGSNDSMFNISITSPGNAISNGAIVPVARVFMPASIGENGTAAPLWLQASGYQNSPNLSGVLVTAGNGGAPTDHWTLFTPNIGQMLGSPTSRIPPDIQDTAVGTDGTVGLNGRGYAIRDQYQISSYIGSVFDNVSWIERLTATTKTIRTPNFLLPSMSGLPSSGNYCLQISSTGAVTPTSAACVTALTVVANTTITVASGTRGANSCSSPATATMTGLTTAMVALPGYSSNPSALTGWGSTGGMVFQAWPSATNTLSWIVCNQTGASITYSAITFNVGAK